MVTKTINKEVLITTNTLVENNIMSLLNQRGASLNWLAGQIKMTRTGLEKALKKETIELKRVFQIADILNVKLSELLPLDDSIKFNLNDKIKIELLEKIIVEKEKQIKDKEEIIQLLKQQLRQS